MLFPASACFGFLLKLKEMMVMITNMTFGNGCRNEAAGSFLPGDRHWISAVADNALMGDPKNESGVFGNNKSIFSS